MVSDHHLSTNLKTHKFQGQPPAKLQTGLLEDKQLKNIYDGLLLRTRMYRINHIMLNFILFGRVTILLMYYRQYSV